MVLGAMLGIPFFMAPAVAVIQFRFRQVSRTLTTVIGVVSSMVVWRLVGMISDPSFAADLAFQAFDPLVAAYLALFCLPCLAAALRG